MPESDGDQAVEVVPFARASRVETIGTGAARAELLDAYSFDGVPNGGYLQAVAMRAALAGGAGWPLAVTTEFLGRAVTGAVDIEVGPDLRPGRRFRTVAVTLRQDGRPVTHSLVTSTAAPPSPEVVWSCPTPDRTPVSDCVVLSGSSRRAGLAGQVELRVDPAHAAWLEKRPVGIAELSASFVLRSGEAPDPYVLALATDALPPAVVNLGMRGWAPTVRLDWHLRALPASGWLYVRSSTRRVSADLFDEDVEVWDEAGQLVAQSRQLALPSRPRRPDTTTSAAQKG